MADARLIARPSTVGRASGGTWVGAMGTRSGAAFSADYLHQLAQEGRIFFASDADQNDQLTGQTSFADTTPTLLLNVPSGYCAVPLYLRLMQAGTVAGDFIDVILEIDNIAAYASGGTAETILSSRTDQPVAPSCGLYSGATATAGYGVAVAHYRMAEDVDPASADAQQFGLVWQPAVPMYLVGPASFKVFTFAGTTGPTWRWSIAWAEVPVAEIAG